MLEVIRSRAAFILFLFLAGCTTVGPDYHRPDVDVPSGWRVNYKTAADLANAEWWKGFKDPALDGLIHSALEDNKDLRIASYRVQEYAAALQVSQSGSMPQLGYGVSASRDSFSLNRPIPLPDDTSRINGNYQANLGLSWELDLWGRIRRSNEAALATLLSAEQGRRSVILTLISDVATSYIDLLNLDAQLQIARNTLEGRRQSLHLFEIKFKGGAVSELELAQVRSEYEEAAAYVPALERRIAVAENALSVLIGRNPASITRDRGITELVLPPVPEGLPSELLVRRPDIVEKEQNLIAANAQIGIAKSQYFPSISLTGILGYASIALSDLSGADSLFWTAGANAAGTIVSGGRISGNVEQAEAVKQEVLNDYLRTIQKAFQEVDDALISHAKYQEELEIQQRRVVALQDYARIANKRYDDGFSTYLEVLYAERSLYAGQIALAQTRHDVYASLVSIYKALGGGWNNTGDQGKGKQFTDTNASKANPAEPLKTDKDKI
jgi:multidrug efflux system outer membrane protein